MKGVKKILIKNKSALAGVIEALLLVGLVAIILSTIQLVYIPEIMKQKESSHLDEVENQFANIKSVIDTQSMMGVMQSDEAIAYSPMFSPVKLGVKELPYFVTSNVYGRIQITDIDDSNNLIDIKPSISDDKYINGVPLTSIEYILSSMYHDDIREFKYIYEGGGVIRNQTGSPNSTGEAMKVNPPITVENNSGSIKIYYYIPVFRCPPGKNNVGNSILTKYIRTNYSNHLKHTTPPGTLTDPAAHYIKIYSDHLDAWYSCFMDNRLGLLWEYEKNNYIDVVYHSQETNPYIEINPDDWDIEVDFTIVEIGIQTGYGTVIT